VSLQSPAGETPAPAAEDSRNAHGLQTSTRDPDELRSSLEAWFRSAHSDARVTAFEMPEHTGMSSLTVLMEVEGRRPAGAAPERLVARIAPDSTAVPVFPTYDLEKQFLILEHLSQSGAVPVPRVRLLELDTEPLGVPFFVMDRVDGEIPADILPYPFGSWLSEADRADQARLQDAALRALAAVHGVPMPDDLARRLAFDRPGATLLERHVAEQRAYYEWCAADGVRSSVIEEGFSWLEANWPSEVADDVRLSWGDARIGNMVFRDFSPVALLDWEMAGLGPREIDLGWMIYLHRWFDDIATLMAIEPMRHFMRVPDAVSAYEAWSGVTVRDIRWYLFYAALRHGSIMFRVARRPIAFGQAVMPEDPNDLILHRSTLEAMLSGEYWAGFRA